MKCLEAALKKQPPFIRSICICGNKRNNYLAPMYHLKKSLGQHFLKDEGVVNKILKALEAHDHSALLEVGPGGGALTKGLLAKQGINFLAVEVDAEKVDYLKKQFPELKVIHKSFLEMEKPFEVPFTVIGNFPYNISSQIIFKILDWYPSVTHVVGMFQKEVAERIAARPGTKDYGIISVLTQYYYDVSYLFSVGRHAFNPPPKVESAVIRLNARTELLPVKSEKDFKKIVKASFAHRRKTLRNNLKGFIAPEKLKEPLFDRRAEELSVEGFAELSYY